jgi:hypothetical protein
MINSSASPCLTFILIQFCRVGNPTHIKIQSTDRILKMEDDAQQSRGAPRSWKIVGVIFSIILLLVWVAKSKRLLKLKASRREKKY